MRKRTRKTARKTVGKSITIKNCRFVTKQIDAKQAHEYGIELMKAIQGLVELLRTLPHFQFVPAIQIDAENTLTRAGDESR